jgi:RNA-splicing ligase RtcB
MLKSELVQKIERLEDQLANALENSVGSASMRTLSTALLDKISEQQTEVEAESDLVDKKGGALEQAYALADKADDIAIELESFE